VQIYSKQISTKRELQNINEKSTNIYEKYNSIIRCEYPNHFFSYLSKKFGDYYGI